MLALPPSGLWFLAWFALVPVFLATRQTRLVTGVIAGILASLVAGFIAVSGVFYHQGIGPDGEPMWTYLACALFGFVFAIVAGISAEMKGR